MKNPGKVLANKANVPELLKTKQIDVLMTLGAEDIDTLMEPIEKWLAGKSLLGI